jgi:hypothetical protein
MLRITTHNEATATTFLVEGTLTGPWVRELEKCWDSVSAAEPSRELFVNLTAATFVDSEGRELLTRMRRHGARLVSAGVLMNAIVAEIEAEAGAGRRAMSPRTRKVAAGKAHKRAPSSSVERRAGDTEGSNT